MAGEPIEDAISPCIGVCRMDECLGICVGCGRTRDDLEAWMWLSNEDRQILSEQAEKRLIKIFNGDRP